MSAFSTPKMTVTEQKITAGICSQANKFLLFSVSKARQSVRIINLAAVGFLLRHMGWLMWICNFSANSFR